MNNEEGKKIVGKTVESASITGDNVTITFTDGTKFDYDATDGGYSCWSITQEEKPH